MSTLTSGSSAADSVPPYLRRQSLSRRRRLTDAAVRVAIWLSLIIAVVPLGLVTYYVIVKGSHIMSWEFLTARIPRQAQTAVGGVGPAVAGTLLITGTAAVIAIPLGVLGAVFLNEYGMQSALARTIRTMSDVMTGVPSVMMGLFVYIGFVQHCPAGPDLPQCGRTLRCRRRSGLGGRPHARRDRSPHHHHRSFHRQPVRHQATVRHGIKERET